MIPNLDSRHIYVFWYYFLIDSERERGERKRTSEERGGWGRYSVQDGQHDAGSGAFFQLSLFWRVVF